MKPLTSCFPESGTYEGQKNRTQFLTLLASDCSLDSTTRLALGESSPTPEAVIFSQRVPPLHLSPFPSPRCGAHNSQEGGRTLFELENVHVERGARGLMGLTSPSQVADIKKRKTPLIGTVWGASAWAPSQWRRGTSTQEDAQGLGWIQSETGVSLWRTRPRCICQTGNLERPEAGEGGRQSCPP